MGKILKFPTDAARRCYAVEMYRHGAVARIEVVPRQSCAEGSLTIAEERKWRLHRPDLRPAEELTGVTVMRIEVRALNQDEAIERADEKRLKLLADNKWQVGYSEEGKA